jgi:hypothetical protein
MGLSATLKDHYTKLCLGEGSLHWGNRRILGNPKNSPATSLRLSFFNVQYTYFIS